MAVAGIFLKGNFANIVTLEGTKEDHKIIAEDVKQIELGKNPTQKDVVKLGETIKKFIDKNEITEFVLNRRITAGQMAGAAGTFLWEGILLTMSPVPLRFIHVATIRATEKKHGDKKTLKPKDNPVQEKAYDFAFEGL